MKKTFPLHAPAHDDRRVVEAIVHDVRKYLKRERRKALPAGFDQWDFNCRVGPNAETAATVAVREVIAVIATIALSGAGAVYVEILALAAKRPGHPAPSDAGSALAPQPGP